MGINLDFVAAAVVVVSRHRRNQADLVPRRVLMSY